MIAASNSIAPLPAKSNSNSNSNSNDFVIRTGVRATLLLDGGHVHIQLPVVCLENGALGQTIRVTSLNHRQTYMAQVDANRILRGKLQ